LAGRGGRGRRAEKPELADDGLVKAVEELGPVCLDVQVPRSLLKLPGVMEACPDAGRNRPKRRLGSISEPAGKYATMSLKQERIEKTPGMIKLREHGYGAWRSEEVGVMGT
jgi:hypothetical protein